MTLPPALAHLALLPAKLLASVIYRDEERFAEALGLFADRIGRAERVSDPLPFDFTDYYCRRSIQQTQESKRATLF